MEGGSLLQEALSHQAEQRQHGHSFLDHILYMDIHVLNTPTTNAHKNNDSASKIQHLLRLTQVAHEANRFFQASAKSRHHDWHIGGDGPVFGIHATKGIPHLRAICRYGANVADEWMAISLILAFTSQQINNNQGNHDRKNNDNDDVGDLVVECWDVQDGQILLIESANVLPEWVDDIGPEACRHRCWIRQGKVVLIEPSSEDKHDHFHNKLELGGALDILRQDKLSGKSLVEESDLVQRAILECIQRYIPSANNTVATSHSDDAHTIQGVKDESNKKSSQKHKAAIAVPRTVAFLIKQRPDLVNAAIVAFANSALDPLLTTPAPNNKGTVASQNTSQIIGCEDWVWTTHAFSRTNYAMLRTIMSPTWNTEAFVPKEYQSVELRRFQRQCANEATPHLHHAVQVGVRLVAGFNALIQQQQVPPQPPSQSSLSSLSLHERRILYFWPRLLQGECNLSAQWLQEAWQAGPNHAQYNLEHLLACPVVTEEMESQLDNLTPLSRPELSVAEQIRNELRSKSGSSQSSDFVMPRQDEVDSGENWMLLAPDTVEEQMQDMRGEHRTKNKSNSTNEESPKGEDQAKVEQLDTMLGGFENFMVERSGADGITNVQDKSKFSNPAASNNRDEQRVQIDPRVFLHLLKATLDPSTSPETMIQVLDSSANAEDYQFFSKDDYEAMLPDNEDADDDDEENIPMDTDVVELMVSRFLVSNIPYLLQYELIFHFSFSLLN